MQSCFAPPGYSTWPPDDPPSAPAAVMMREQAGRRVLRAVVGAVYGLVDAICTGRSLRRVKTSRPGVFRALNASKQADIEQSSLRPGHYTTVNRPTCQRP